jgi:hypothetical protein
MNITITTASRRLTASLIKQMPFADAGIILQAIATPGAVLGHVVLPKRSYYLLHVDSLYYRVSKKMWKRSIHDKYKVFCGNTYKEFPTKEGVDNFLKTYNQLKHLASLQIYL